MLQKKFKTEFVDGRPVIIRVRRGGLTLIEVLVIVAIFVVLISIVIPAFTVINRTPGHSEQRNETFTRVPPIPDKATDYKDHGNGWHSFQFRVFDRTRKFMVHREKYGNGGGNSINETVVELQD